MSDLGRHDLALEVIADVDGREAIRLRVGYLWAAKRWRSRPSRSSCSTANRWKDFEPLTDVERADIYVPTSAMPSAEDKIGLGRFREKYAPKMANTPDAHAFDVVSAPLGASSDEFRDIAHAAASVDTLDGFLRDMNTRFPPSDSSPPAASDGRPPPRWSLQRRCLRCESRAQIRRSWRPFRRGERRDAPRCGKACLIKISIGL